MVGTSGQVRATVYTFAGGWLATKLEQYCSVWQQLQTEAPHEHPEESMVTRARQLLLYSKSSVQKASQADIIVKTGRKWKVRDQESCIQQRVRVGTVASSQPGIGGFTTTCYNQAQGKDRCNRSKRRKRWS